MEGETECNDEDEDCSVEKLSHEDLEKVQANSDDSNLGASLEAVEKEEEEEKKPEGFESVANII